ncbi:inositol monophosphatase family protein [Curtobacterium sp. MCSS17_007]|uniref:inositol monophosphatase family protein n=1 Tax=Curtobacterium sp. MCSS17_007 TaxID=2175646 RepID=UPI000DA9D681|nr:inositol monophosphatase family protein [Curtobacterium sp. MCSS17_007]WIE77049.1 inositol monophosphatase family protein [Curtobacterium sp. MCSS17_007]
MDDHATADAAVTGTPLTDAALAAALVTDAARLAADMREGGTTAERKTSAADLVTAADRAAEDLVRTALLRHRPDDGVLGEEGARVDAVDGRRWTVDPIDGTYNYVAGLPAWCSAVSLEADGALLVGAVRRHLPAETWVASDGRTTRDGVPVPAVPDVPLAGSSVATFLNASHLRGDAAVPMVELLAAAATVRVSGSGSCDLADVAAGRIGLWVQTDCADWDWLPGRALVEGAGGAAVVVRAQGHDWHLAGAPTAVREAVALLTA